MGGGRIGFASIGINKMKVFSHSKSKTITLLGMSNIIGSSTANPNQYEQYLYTQDEVTEVYLRRAYKSDEDGNYNSIRGYAPPMNAGGGHPLYIRMCKSRQKIWR